MRMPNTCLVDSNVYVHIFDCIKLRCIFIYVFLIKAMESLKNNCKAILMKIAQLNLM